MRLAHAAASRCGRQLIAAVSALAITFATPLAGVGNRPEEGGAHEPQSGFERTSAQPVKEGIQHCPAGHANLDGPLHDAVDAGETEPRDVIVRLRPGQLAKHRQLLTGRGARVRRHFAGINSLSATVRGHDLAVLAADPAVERVSADAPVRASFATAAEFDDERSTEPGLVPVHKTLGLSNSWSGEKIGVALIDSGLQPTEDFRDRIRAFHDFTLGGVPTHPSDAFGHGTHVAGLIGAAGQSYSEFRGLAPKVSFIVLRVLDGRGVGKTSDVIAALEFAIANRTTLGIDVINLSLGHPIYEPAAEDPLVLAVENAVRAGIVVVIAAGNYGSSLETGELAYAGIASPANAPSAITVGAFTMLGTVNRLDDQLASYSSRGPTWYDTFAKPDIVAPGHNLAASASVGSWLHQTYPGLHADSGNGAYMRLSGTSMAAGVTTGVVVLMLEANRHTNSYPSAPSLSPNAVKAVLQYTAISLLDASGAPRHPLQQGAGGLNGTGSIELARALRTDAGVDAYWVDPSHAPQSTSSRIGDHILPWGQTLLWNDTILSGDPLAVNFEAWSPSVIWGSGKTLLWGAAKTLLWGSNVVWENPSIWTSTLVWGSTSIGSIDLSSNTLLWGATDGLTPETTAFASLEGALVPETDPGALTIDR